MDETEVTRAAWRTLLTFPPPGPLSTTTSRRPNPPSPPPLLSSRSFLRSILLSYSSTPAFKHHFNASTITPQSHGIFLSNTASADTLFAAYTASMGTLSISRSSPSWGPSSHSPKLRSRARVRADVGIWVPPVLRFLLKGDQTGARAVHAHPGISIKRVFAHPVLGRGGKAGGACAAHELVVGLEQARGPSRGGPLPAAAQSAPLAAALLGRVAIEASAVLRALVGRRPLPQSVVPTGSTTGVLSNDSEVAEGSEDAWMELKPYLKAQTVSSIIKIVSSIVAVCHNNLPPASVQQGNDILRELSNHMNKLSEVQAMCNTPTTQPWTGVTPRGSIFDVELGSVFPVIPIPIPISMPTLISPSVFSSSIWKPRSLSAYC
ncbi:hypothetical protein HETIRDRAFT_108707 [Heterobasidion irregulare TC 32-1]|uniref:Uncharacterized protein n=1 Tax=Heterobasidion irregulare (strain TC 32-1) TaxID=747525 RepID=W4KAL5_HETIT|nr:uncharacterized protein HETIRDRAFT_108707 [Heterobasidion irregulare TC 32-1]ETW82405.1 hypothetical protein HETIRDRAFT_108707 [Heterobasidion irregulare TC 32-1]